MQGGKNGSFNGWWCVTEGAGSKAFSVLKTHTVPRTAVERKKDFHGLGKSKQTKKDLSESPAPALSLLEPLLK